MRSGDHFGNRLYKFPPESTDPIDWLPFGIEMAAIGARLIHPPWGTIDSIFSLGKDLLEGLFIE